MIIQKQIEINASPQKVWKVFTDPELSRKMGGEYVSEWKKGSAFGWKGKDGKMLTHGTILEIEPGKWLKHNLFDPQDKSIELSVITYVFSEKDGNTLLQASEELRYNVTEEQYKDASAGWDAALNAVKHVAEGL